MANSKLISVDYIQTGKTVYVVVRRESDYFLLDDVNLGVFSGSAVAPNICMELVENPIIKGKYEISETRQVWVDGTYNITAYLQNGGTPNPVNDMIVGGGEFAVVNDIEVNEINLPTNIDNLLSANHGTGSWQSFNLSVGTNQVDIFAVSAPVTGLFPDPGGTPIIDVSVQIFNSNNTILLVSQRTDTLGKISCAMDDGIYSLRMFKSGLSFTIPDSITVSGALAVSGVCSFTREGSIVEIGTPSGANACRVYERCFSPDAVTPLPYITATAKIVKLPYDYGYNLHAGQIVEPIYDPNTGLAYWDLVWGATVDFWIDTILFKSVRKVIPNITTARLTDLL